MSNIILLNAVDGELETTFAYFANQANENHNLGVCSYDLPVFDDENGKWYIHNIHGETAAGDIFEYGTLEVGSDFEDFNEYRLNPSKVFWYIVKKIKGVLCPSCM